MIQVRAVPWRAARDADLQFGVFAYEDAGIAGPAWAGSDGPYCPEGGTGALVRTTLEYLGGL